MKHLAIAFLAASAVVGCAPGQAAKDVKVQDEKPTTGFQKLIYDDNGFLVLRDRVTGCHWIGALNHSNALVALVPRNHLAGNDVVEQLCTVSSDSRSQPMKIVGTNGLFQHGENETLGSKAYVSTFTDMETGCHWIMAADREGAISILPRTAMLKGKVQQVCEPLQPVG